MKKIATTAKRACIYVRTDKAGKRIYWADDASFEWDTGKVDIETIKTILWLEQEALQGDRLLNKENRYEH
jgi:hypothetical protein